MHLPGFKVSCLVIGGVYVVIAASLLLQGVPAVMAEYNVPATTIEIPHYVDAMTWVFFHMLVIGSMIATVGFFADESRLQRPFARLLALATIVYLCMDLHTADWSPGKALYQGPRSLVPVGVDVVSLLTWLRLSVVRALPKSS